MNPIQSSEGIRIVYEAMVGEELRRHRLPPGTRTSPREVLRAFLLAVGTRIAPSDRETAAVAPSASVRPFPHSIPGQSGPEGGEGVAVSAVKETRPAA